VDVTLLYVCLYARCLKGFVRTSNSYRKRVQIAFVWFRKVVSEHDSESMGSLNRGKFL
jgi:hypothetical protein